MEQAQYEDELIGTLIEFPHMFDEYRIELTEDLFPLYTDILKTMGVAADEEGLSYRALVNRFSMNEITLINDLKRLAYNENRVPLLIEQAKSEKLRKNILDLSSRIQETAFTHDPDEMLREILNKTDTMQTVGMSKIPNSRLDVEETMNWISDIHDDPTMAYGMTCQIPAIDGMTNGWQRKEMSVIGARTSMGKSLFLIDQALRIHLNGHKVAIFSLEMSKREVYMRMMSNLIQNDYKWLKQGRLPKTTIEFLRTKREQLYGLTVEDSRGVDAEFIADMMRSIKRKEGLDFVIVDYLQDVKEKGEHNDNSGSALARVCRKLRKAAKECDCHVMTASQVSRSVEDRQDKRPGSSDLSGSTGIETSADVIAMLYRDEYYNPDTDRRGILEVNFTKQRNGECGKVEVAVNLKTQRIASLNG